MKTYQDKHELARDINFINNLNMNQQIKDEVHIELFNMWKYYGKDSPWNGPEKWAIRETEEKDAVETLMKISEEGISNEWCGEHIIYETLDKKPKSKYNLRERKMKK